MRAPCRDFKFCTVRRIITSFAQVGVTQAFLPTREGGKGEGVLYAMFRAFKRGFIVSSAFSQWGRGSFNDQLSKNQLHNLYENQ